MQNVVKDFSKEKYFNSKNKDSLKSLILALPPSTLKNDLLFDISYQYLQEQDSINFFFWNDKTFDLSKELKDTLKIAESHWDRASFYYAREKADSAFYHYRKAAKLYKQQQDDAHYSGMLLNIGILQRHARDLVRSEASTTEGLKIAIRRKDKNRMYIGYNSLALLHNHLGEYSNSLGFHKKALKVAQELQKPQWEITTLNNMGVVHENLEQYKDAISYYKRALTIDSNDIKETRIYPMLIDNIAYSRFKMDSTADVLPEFQRSLELRQKIDHQSGIVIQKIHLGEYFLAKGDTAQAEDYFKSAKKLAKDIHQPREILTALRFFSKVNPENSQEAFDSYVTLSDSLEREERAAQAKFARIELQTDEYISHNRQLVEERSWILIGSGSAVALLFLTFVLWRQRANNKKLELEHEQQKMNAQIYNLMLSQEKKIEEGRKNEKLRISRELHDGVLSSMYGIRFNLSNLLTKNDEDSIKSQKMLLNHLKNIEEEIRNISRDLQKEEESKDTGFVHIVDDYCAKQKEVIGIEGEFENDPTISWSDIAVEDQMNLFRITQEAIQNVRRHAGATFFSVNFKKPEEGLLQLTIRDNGLGFDIDKKTKGIGLKNIKERVEQMEGTIKIHSGNEGTELHIWVKISSGGIN